MPISQMFTGLSTRAEGAVSSFWKTITDSFSRTTSVSLGTTPYGQVWTQTNGTWYANNGQAFTSSPATNYPYATIPYKANMTATLNIASPGTGIVFWQTDSNDWWAAAASSSTSSYTYTGTYSYCIPNSCCTGSTSTCKSDACCSLTTGVPAYNCGAGYIPGYYNPGGYNSCCTGSNNCQSSTRCGAYFSTCCTGSPSACVASTKCGASGKYAGTYSSCCTHANTCVASGYCGSVGYRACCNGSNNCQSSTTCGAGPVPGYLYPGVYSPTCGAGECISSDCCMGSPSTCKSDNCCSIGYGSGPVNGTQWQWSLNIYRSIAGIVSNIVSSVLATTNSQNYGASEQINAIKVTTLGTNVTATGYSDSSATKTLGSISTTNTGQRGYGVGIISTPEGYSSGNTTGPFTAQ